jgi:hypothetical protein
MFFGSGAQISGTALLDVPHPGAESKGCYIEKGMGRWLIRHQLARRYCADLRYAYWSYLVGRERYASCAKPG